MLQRTNIYLPDEMIAFLKTQAEMEKVTMSDIVRRELTRSIRQKKTNWVQSLLALSKKAKGSGLPDLSKRHDYYLYIEPYERRQRQLRERMKKRKKK